MSLSCLAPQFKGTHGRVASDYNTIVSDRPLEFWEEESIAGRRDMRRYALRWALIFAALIGGIFFAIWWSSSAVHFSSSRVQQTTGPTYRVTGRIHDSAGNAVPWEIGRASCRERV